ncbi:MAG: heavy-metal-associated domain-containing protein [Pirellulales bacterium]|nr:heavy-metal-associated domain-containing protein [Pirellulales bacterium]
MLFRSRCVALACLVLLFGATSVGAADRTPVQLENMHLCCKTCSNDLTDALSSVEGIEQIEVDRKTASARFLSPSDEKTQEALGAMAEAGFFATATQGDKKLTVPTEKIEPELKADRIVFEGVHLCCGGCAKGVVQGYTDLTDVVAVDCDVDERTVTLTGKELSVAQMREALHKAGFSGKLVRK